MKMSVTLKKFGLQKAFDYLYKDPEKHIYLYKDPEKHI